VFVDPGRDRDFKAPVTCTAAAWDRKTRTKDDDEDDKKAFEGRRSDTQGIERKEPGKRIFLENPRLDRLIVRSAAARTAK
jgi:hypothetical protein